MSLVYSVSELRKRPFFSCSSSLTHYLVSFSFFVGMESSSSQSHPYTRLHLAIVCNTPSQHFHHLENLSWFFRIDSYGLLSSGFTFLELFLILDITVSTRNWMNSQSVSKLHPRSNPMFPPSSPKR